MYKKENVNLLIQFWNFGFSQALILHYFKISFKFNWEQTLLDLVIWFAHWLVCFGSHCGLFFFIICF
jgi:hypothetical protein